MKKLFYLILISTGIVYSISCKNKSQSEKHESIKAEIEKILKIQEDAYDQNNEAARQSLLATCKDSLVFIGGDDGGLVSSADFYIHDLADGYTVRPHDRVFRIYDRTVIVSSIHQGFKLFNKDTLYLNARSTKVFVKEGSSWKMAYVTYAPLPVLYHQVRYDHPSVYKEYKGVYQESASATDTILVIGGKIYVSTMGYPKSELLPINDSTFIGDGYFGKTIFVRNNQGMVTHYAFEFPDGQRLVFLKLK